MYSLITHIVFCSAYFQLHICIIVLNHHFYIILFDTHFVMLHDIVRSGNFLVQSLVMSQYYHITFMASYEMRSGMTSYDIMVVE